MDLRDLEKVIKESEGGIEEKKENLISNMKKEGNPRHLFDSASALQLFLDRIPISSIPGLQNSASVVELKTGDTVRDAIRLLNDKDVFGAPIAGDTLFHSDSNVPQRGSDRYIGFIDLASMLLWCLEECLKDPIETNEDGSHGAGISGIFSMLEQNPNVGQTKVGELAKSFLWEPFFPVHLDDTLFHVLMLFAKHRIQVVPVIERFDSHVIGFVSQNAVIHLLLQSCGLEWFDSIANKALKDFRFESEGQAVSITGDQNLAEALKVLWEKRVDAVAVVDRGTGRLIGSIRRSDVYLLLDNDDLFFNRKSLKVEEFIRLEAIRREFDSDSDPIIERNLGALLAAGNLRLRNRFLPRMDSPVTNRKTDSLKQAMEDLAETKSYFSFLVDETGRVTGVLKLRDVITQFAPPSMDSTIDGGGFFHSALEQAGCHLEDGTLVCGN